MILRAFIFTVRLGLALALMCAAVLPVRGDETRSAREQLDAVQRQLAQSRKNQDWPAFLDQAKQLKLILHGSPDSVMLLARAYVRNGDLPAALRELALFVDMGQSSEQLAKSEEFAMLKDDPDFQKLQQRMKANSAAVAQGTTAIELPAITGLIAEDVDYDAKTRQFFISSVFGKKIFAIDGRGNCRDFASAADGWPLLALKVDAAHRVLWASEVALQDFPVAPKADWGRSALLAFRLQDGKLLKRVEGPAHSALGDLTLTSEGNVIVSDGQGGGVYRLRRNGTQLERLDSGEFVSPQTPAMHPDGRHVYIPDYAIGIALLDLNDKSVRWIATEGKYALSGIDGLYFANGRLIATQNGSSPERVVMFTLDANLTRIESETVIERATETLGDPTHGVVVGNDFYFIANSGWDAVDDQGKPKANVKPTEPHLMRYTLK